MTEELTLYNSPDSCGLIVRYALEAIGVGYDHVELDRSIQQHKSRDYLALNPAGMIPVLKHGDLVMSETAAILLHLADQYPETQLLPALKTPERSLAYKWLLFVANALHADLRVYWYAGRYTDNGDQAADVRENVAQRIKDNFRICEDYLARNKGFFGGEETPNIVDYYLAHMVRGACVYPLDCQDFDPEWTSYPALREWACKLQDRPEIIRACEKESIPCPAIIVAQLPQLDPQRLVG